MTTENGSALAVVPDAPLPVFSGPQMAQAMRAYREVQGAIDELMPDQIMQVGDRKFRKKGYWRATGVSFNVSVELLDERRDVQGAFEDGHENSGWFVTYRAVAPNGRIATGDGACFAIEKAKGRSWKVLPPEATEHNVRSHAHTRAYNRAISNLVGFGEVSADELGDEERTAIQSEARVVPAAGHAVPHVTESELYRIPEPGQPLGEPVISEAQDKRFFAIAKSNGWDTDELRTWLRDRWGLPSSRNIPKSKYEQIVNALSANR